MPNSVLQLDPRDNVLVALKPLDPGEVVQYGAHSCTITQPIPIKHKLAVVDLKPGDLVYLYGMVVAEAVEAIPRGGVISTRTVRHRAGEYSSDRKPAAISAPDASAWARPQ